MPSARTNPFYVLLLVLGIVFAITACAYGVVAVKMSTAQGASRSAGEWLVKVMNEHGLWLLVGELTLLALATFAAIGTDDYWNRDPPLEPPHDAH
jgi:hypothetical protein